MFYFEEINGYKVLKSNLLKEVKHCFTTRGVMPGNVYPEYIYPYPQQTHSDHVEIVDERIEYPDTDGLIITQKNIPIALKFADCTPLIFYDTKQKIGPKTILKMRTNFGSNPEDIIAIIGPAIGICCYEVSDEVRTKLLDTVKDTTNLVQGKNVDLKQINKRQLEEIGVIKIDDCPYCTSCNNDLFYSYRKENGTTNRHYAMLML